ncbi:unnamed protein product [Polarella glacialis]|uniref:Uncharacterized protein n=1 Tax=Polarella glacialis TaxID=89957 RepID=A0A813D709_POLGL|nr:unnamed protein product [Polarella glacialis]
MRRWAQQIRGCAAVNLEALPDSEQLLEALRGRLRNGSHVGVIFDETDVDDETHSELRFVKSARLDFLGQPFEDRGEEQGLSNDAFVQKFGLVRDLSFRQGGFSFKQQFRSTDWWGSVYR